MNDAVRIDCGCGVLLERGVRCRMSDGTELVSDHYYPPERGPQPTLLMRQPYGRAIASTVVYAHPAWFARQGYNVVIQDVRGRGDSGGEFYPFRSEARDGAETIAWVRKRPECNGRVGMYGFSYQGMTQLLAAAEQPEGLECIAPAMTGYDLYHGWFYQGGALRLAGTLAWGAQILKTDVRRLKLQAASDRLEEAWANLGALVNVLPFRAHPAFHGEGVPGYVLDWLDHDRPDDYWAALDVSRSFQRISVPALHVSGWYDVFLRGSVAGFLALRAGAATPRAREGQYLIAGPWMHIPWGDRIGPADFGPEALLDTDAILLRWFNHWLKETNEYAAEPRVRHFVMGENRWHEANDWPAEPYTSFYLQSGGRANSRKGDGRLSAAPPADEEPPDVFVHDPEVPVAAPAPGGAIGPFDQAALELGNNLLVYTSRPLPAPTVIFGSPRVKLHCATSAPHADFVAKLVRVRRNGAADFLCIGTARSASLFAEQSYAADKTHMWAFALEPTSCRFETGDRVRLEIASSAFPLFDRNTGSGVPSARATSWDWRRSTHFVHHSVQWPSVLELPMSEAAR
jgi:putative CocE/NonD family hydrolase